jgi:hypothetical protein
MMRFAVPGLVIAPALLVMAWLNWHWHQTSLDVAPIPPERKANLAHPEAAASSAPASESGVGSAFFEALLRPLFHPTRRPFEPPAEPSESVPELAEVFDESVVAFTLEQEPAELEPLAFNLAGISLSSGNKQALLGTSAGADMRWMALGDSINGWTVTAITRNDVILVSGDRTVAVQLYSADDPAHTGR